MYRRNETRTDILRETYNKILVPEIQVKDSALCHVSLVDYVIGIISRILRETKDIAQTDTGSVSITRRTGSQ